MSYIFNDLKESTKNQFAREFGIHDGIEGLSNLFMD